MTIATLRRPLAMILLGSALALGACRHKDQPADKSEGPFTRAGRNIDEAGRDAVDAGKKAAQDVKGAAKELKDDLKQQLK